MRDDELPGLDPVRLRAWLDTRHPSLAGGPFQARLLVGGLSNLTFRLDDGEHRWVLRRPPLGHVLSTAHDMHREHRIIAALKDTAVPVPATLLAADDPDGEAGVGAPFYLMEFVEGETLNSPADNAGRDPRWIAGLAPALVEVLAALHALDPLPLGLGDFGRPAGFLERQVRRWGRQLDQSRSRPLGELDELAARVAATVPDSAEVSIVHGDFRLDNTLIATVQGRPRVAAVLDWEMSTLGDPLTDLGLLGVYWSLHRIPEAARSPLASAIDPAAGYPPFESLVDDYARLRGIPAPDVSWYVGFASYKLAVILEGIHYRHTQGLTVGAGFDTVGALVPALARFGLDALTQR